MTRMKRKPQALAPVLLIPLMGLTGCGIITPQAVYEGIRTQESARAVGTPAPAKTLPAYDQYQKERAILAPQKAD
jgi:hypothetical protein